MFYWILWALLTSIWDIFYKKSILLSQWKVSNIWFQLLRWFIASILMLIIFLILLALGVEKIYFFWFWAISLMFVMWAVNAFSNLFRSYAYKNEKVSVLAPYQESETIITVIMWFFLFSGVSVITFISVLIAWFILFLGSIDLKNLKFNKYVWALVLATFFISIRENILAYLLIYSITPVNLVLYSNTFSLLCVFIFIVLKIKFSWKKLSLSKAKALDKKTLIFTSFDNLVRIWVTLVYAYLIAEIWIVEASLLGLLTIFSNMLFAYFVFKEVPEKKDYIIAGSVLLCIFLWTYYWN